MFLNLGDKTYYLRAQLSLQIESRTWVSSHVAQRREKVGIDGAQSRVVPARQHVRFSHDCDLFKTAFSKRPLISNGKTIRQCISDVSCDTRQWNSITTVFLPKVCHESVALSYSLSHSVFLNFFKNRQIFTNLGPLRLSVNDNGDKSQHILVLNGCNRLVKKNRYLFFYCFFLYR